MHALLALHPLGAASLALRPLVLRPFGIGMALQSILSYFHQPILVFQNLRRIDE
jgi:hypothetical protein